MSWMLVIRTFAAIRDCTAACPRWLGRTGSRRTNRRDRLRLGSHGDQGK
jgi:hypothetical protein